MKFDPEKLAAMVVGTIVKAVDGPKVGGRLVTVNGFTLAPSGTGKDLAVDLSITTYVLPDSQGLTAGATAEAPPATVPAPATSVPTSTPPAP